MSTAESGHKLQNTIYQKIARLKRQCSKANALS